MAARQGTKLKDHRVLALDIGSRFIKISELRLARGIISLLNVVVCPTPAETVDKSQILNPDALGKEIRRLLKENKIATRKVVVAVRSQSSVVVRPIDLPKMSSKELADTMKFEVERHVPFSADEIVMDYAPFVAPEELPETEENMKVLLAVAQEELINAYLKVLKVAGLTPQALDVEILATIRGLVDIHQNEGAYEHTVALVNLGAASTDISILQHGNLAFTRSVPIAGDALTSAIGEQLGRTFDEAEELKKEHGQIFLETAVGELPTPEDEGIITPDEVNAAPSSAPLFAFDTDDGMDATMAWENKGPVPQQIFSLEDDIEQVPFSLDDSNEAATPAQDATQLLNQPAQTEASAQQDDVPVFRFGDDDQDATPFFSFDNDTSKDDDDMGAVFNLSSELEGQLPSSRQRPVANTDDDDTPVSLFDVTANSKPVENTQLNLQSDEHTDSVGTSPTDTSTESVSSTVADEFTLLGSQDNVSLLGGSTEDKPAPQNEIFQRRIFESMQPTLMELVTELRRSLEFFSTREPNSPVEQILLYGGTSRLPNLAEFIHQEVGLDVLYADPLQALDTNSCRLSSEYLQDLSPVLPVCIGLGLRDMLA